MTIFYFNLHECGIDTIDSEGHELADVVAARAAAVAAARDVMSAEVKMGKLCLSCHIVIEDADHREVARVPFREALTVSGI